MVDLDFPHRQEDGSIVIKNGAEVLSSTVFGVIFKPSLVSQVVLAYLAKARLGTKAQKSRSEVRGGGKKPWRQKGSGRARAGTIRSPLWRGGGVTFAAKPRDFSQKVNKKMYAAAMRAIFSELIRLRQVAVVDNLVLSAPKTKMLLDYLHDFRETKTLILVNDIDKNLLLAARNVHNINIIKVDNINPVVLLNCDNILVTLSALRTLEGLLA